MAERRVCWSRRAAVVTALQSISGALLFPTGSAFASEKMTRAQAQYQDMPSGIYSCGMCSLFEAPNACKVVEGEISKDGWCKAFALQD